MLKTEMRNPNTTNLDKMTTIEMIRAINNENYNSVRAVEKAEEQIAEAVEAITKAFENGKKLYFIGAGTSGRLHLLLLKAFGGSANGKDRVGILMKSFSFPLSGT